MAKYLDDVLLLAGCVCILVGLAQLSGPVTWIAAGMMLIGFGVMAAKDSDDVPETTGNEQ